MTEVIAKDQLEQFINQIEKLEDEKSDLAEAI
ncbi:MAG: GapR family DNA-binding domain-containing protein, partial [Chitinophagaceae bacterium]